VPWLASAVGGLALVPATAVMLFLLSVFDRVTAGWTRRVALVAALLVALGAAVGLAAGKEVLPSLATGAIQGAVSFAFAWLLLRYDLRTVPAFVATGIVLDAAHDALVASTPSGWVSFAIAAAVTLALAWRAVLLLAPRSPKPI
jgi:hypothetical protein